MTLFSAPNYCGEFDNAGAMMSVDETLMCSFQVDVGKRPLCVPSKWVWGKGCLAQHQDLIRVLSFRSSSPLIRIRGSMGSSVA